MSKPRKLILIISRAQEFRDVLDRETNQEVRYLSYGQSFMGLRPDVVILMDEPLNDTGRQWLQFAKQCCRPDTVYIDATGDKAKVAQPYSNPDHNLR